MDDVGLDALLAQPPRQPETVAARLEGDGHALDRVAGLGGFLAPALQQGHQRRRIRLELLQRLPYEARNEARDEPALQAHLDHRNQRAMLLKGDEATAQVICLGHGRFSIGVQRQW